MVARLVSRCHRGLPGRWRAALVAPAGWRSAIVNERHRAGAVRDVTRYSCWRDIRRSAGRAPNTTLTAARSDRREGWCSATRRQRCQLQLRWRLNQSVTAASTRRASAVWGPARCRARRRRHAPSRGCWSRPPAPGRGSAAEARPATVGSGAGRPDRPWRRLSAKLRGQCADRSPHEADQGARARSGAHATYGTPVAMPVTTCFSSPIAHSNLV